jgi:hypothetical protein
MQHNLIVLPTRAQPDTIVAIFLLKKLGEEKLPGISEAQVAVWQQMPEGQTEEEVSAQGTILIDIGGGTFDHHSKEPRTTASELVAEFLGVREDPAITKLLEYTRRDDFFGKGTVSEDPLDRAFGLSGLIANLNRKYVGEHAKVVEIVLPLIDAHYAEEFRRTKELPEEFDKKLKEGKVEMFTVRQRDKNLKCVYIDSESASMAGFLRSQNGGRFDVVVQKLSSGHTNILTRPTKKVDLRMLAAIIREAELMKKGVTHMPDVRTLAMPGKIQEVPEWYFDPATNSIQNGGLNPTSITATQIDREEMVQLVELGLGLEFNRQ